MKLTILGDTNYINDAERKDLNVKSSTSSFDCKNEFWLFVLVNITILGGTNYIKYNAKRKRSKCKI